MQLTPVMTGHRMSKKLLIIVCALLLLCGRVFSAGTTSANFLKIGVGARQSAMGECFTGIADDVNTINYNLAGLAGLRSREFSAMHLEYLEGIRYGSLSYSHPFKWATVGISLGYLYVYNIPRTVIDPTAYTDGWQYRYVGNFGADNRSIILGFARALNDRTSLGAGIRYISETLDDRTSWAVSFDFGGYYKYNDRVSFGATIQNAGTELKFIARRERLPLNLRAGIGYENIKGNFKAGVDIVQAIDSKTEIRTGVEWKVVRALSVRAGYRLRGFDENYKLGIVSGLTGGVGFNFLTYSIDYGFIPYGDLGGTHRFSLTGRF